MSRLAGFGYVSFVFAFGIVVIVCRFWKGVGWGGGLGGYTLSSFSGFCARVWGQNVNSSLGFLIHGPPNLVSL